LNYIVLFSKDIVVLTCGLLSSIFIARHLGPEIYGSYVFIILVLSYFQNFGRFRVSVSILPYLKNNCEHEKIIFPLAFVLNGLMAGVTTFVLLAICSLFGLFKDYSGWIYLLLTLLIFGEFYLTLITYSLTFQSKFKSLAFVINIKSVMQTAGFAWLYFYTSERSVFPYLVVNAGSMIIGVLLGTFLIRSNINLLFLRYRELDIRLYLKTSLMFYLTDIVTFFSTKGVATVVAAKLSITNLAYFNMMFTHFDLLRFPNNALGAMMYPALSKETSDHKQRKYILHKILFNSLIYIPILIAAYFLYPKLVILFYGPEYEIITHYFPYILIICTPYLILYPIGHYFSANGVPQYDGLIKLFSLFIQITGVLLFLYFKDFSLFSAVLSQTFGFIGSTIALLLIYKYKKFNQLSK